MFDTQGETGGLRFPSDAITLRQLRAEMPESFMLSNLSSTFDFCWTDASRQLGELIELEMKLAARANQTKDAVEHQCILNREELISLLDPLYQKLMVSESTAETNQLVEELERDVRRRPNEPR